jgi:hypothetical protein
VRPPPQRGPHRLLLALSGWSAAVTGGASGVSGRAHSLARRGVAMTRCRAAVAGRCAVMTRRAAAVAGRCAVGVRRVASLARWRTRVDRMARRPRNVGGPIGAFARRASRATGCASGVPRRGRSVASGGAAVPVRAFSGPIRLLGLLGLLGVLHSLCVRGLCCLRGNGARTDAVVVAQMRRKRIPRNRDRHERVLLRMGVVTDGHLLRVLGCRCRRTRR